MDGEFESLADALLEALADDGRGDRLLGVHEESRPGVAGALRLRRTLNEMRASDGVDPRWRRDLVRRLAEVAAVDPDAVSELRTFFPRADPAESVSAQVAPAPVGNAVIGDTALGPVSNSVSGGTFLGPVQGAGTQYNYFGPGLHPPLPAVSHWPRLGDADPVALGVRRTRRLPDEPSLPPYVRRDCHSALARMLLDALGTGGLVLVTGEPLSGKTRTAWAAVSHLSERTRIYAPPPGTDLRGLPAVLRGRGDESCVLWLDELERHLGENGLTAAVLAELVQQRTMVVATMNDEAYDAHRFGATASARVLSGVEPVELSGDWSRTELRRLKEYADDLRLWGASVGRGARGVTEYLAIGPELHDEWRRAGRTKARRRGHHVVRAAIDLARCGADGAIPGEVLRSAHELYGAGTWAGAGSFDDALAWAAGVRHGVTGMLVRGPVRDTWSAFGSLTNEVEDQGQDAPPVPLELWPWALEAVRGDERKRTEIVARAHRSLGPSADDDQDVLMMLGSLDLETGDAESAESWYRRAADAGSEQAAGVVGALLVARGAGTEAVPYLETAATAGDIASQSILATVLSERAMFWLTEAAEGGDAEAASRLGHLLLGDERPHEAMKWLRRAADMGYEDVAITIGNIFRDWREPDEAETWYRRAMAHGDTGATNNLALTLEDLGEPAEEIERLFRAAAEAGEISAPVNLGYSAKARGEWDEARRWFEEGHARGAYSGAFALGQLEWEQGNRAAAEEWFGKALEMGNHAAERAIAELRSEGGEAAANVEG